MFCEFWCWKSLDLQWKTFGGRLSGWWVLKGCRCSEAIVGGLFAITVRDKRNARSYLVETIDRDSLETETVWARDSLKLWQCQELNSGLLPSLIPSNHLLKSRHIFTQFEIMITTTAFWRVGTWISWNIDSEMPSLYMIWIFSFRMCPFPWHWFPQDICLLPYPRLWLFTETPNCITMLSLFQITSNWKNLALGWSANQRWVN